ncbi:hypothetical protein J6590_069658 [Homalodisca vitripennis]|nr:hypothetical protein J6590_069658 [Homalodisca vitripennis]
MKALFHLGKVVNDTKVKGIQKFVNRIFPGVEFKIDQLETKENSVSFKLGSTSREERDFTNLRSYGIYIDSYLPTRGDACLDTVATDVNYWQYKGIIAEVLIVERNPSVDIPCDGIQSGVPDCFVCCERYRGIRS